MTDDESIGDWVKDHTEDIDEGTIDYDPGSGPYSGAEERDGGETTPPEPEDDRNLADLILGIAEEYERSTSNLEDMRELHDENMSDESVSDILYD